MAWLTYRQVADLLGCHVSNVAKLVRKGELTSRANGDWRTPALIRGQVQASAGPVSGDDFASRRLPRLWRPGAELGTAWAMSCWVPISKRGG
jgi:hypothetical protein